MVNWCACFLVAIFWGGAGGTSKDIAKCCLFSQAKTYWHFNIFINL